MPRYWHYVNRHIAPCPGPNRGWPGGLWQNAEEIHYFKSEKEARAFVRKLNLPLTEPKRDGSQ